MILFVTGLVELSQFYYIVVIGFVTGYFRAITVINQNLVISEYIEKDKLPQAVGLNMVAKALVTMSVGHSLGKQNMKYIITPKHIIYD